MRLELWRFLGAVSLLLECGYDLSFAWDEAFHRLRGDLSPELRRALGGSRPLARRLRRARFPLASERAWLCVLAELHASGAPVRRTLSAWREALLRAHERELAAFSRTLPLRMNLILLLFFLPPALLALMAPLLFALFRLGAP